VISDTGIGIPLNTKAKARSRCSEPSIHPQDQRRHSQ
jgi:hypothetical protein